MNKNAICTISSLNYIPYGLVCLKSAQLYNNADFFYLIVDEFEIEDIPCVDGVHYITLRDIGLSINDINNLSFKYNIIEFNTAVKPSMFLYLLSRGYDNVTYFDPDMESYSSIYDVLDKYNSYSIFVTPHKTTSVESTLIKDKNFLNNGIFNLGFISLNNDGNSIHFLKWWHSKLRNECFIDYGDGLATDQIWVELAFTIFDGFKILNHPGCNVAFWNIHERNLEKSNDFYTINDYPLVFFHFSSLSLNAKKELLDSLNKICPCFSELYNSHLNCVKKYYKESNASCKKYSYERYENNQVITKYERLLYGFSKKLQKEYVFPFSSNKNSYLDFLNTHPYLTYNSVNNFDRYLCIFVKLFGLKKSINFLGKLSYSTIHHIANMIDEGSK